MFGNAVTNEEWLAKMNLIKTSEDILDSAFCLQEVVQQVEYDIIRHNIEEHEKYHLIGTYLVMNGVYQGLATYRIGRQYLVRINEDQQGLTMYGFTSGEESAF